MAKEIQIVTDTSGQTLYAQVFRSTDGKVWNTAGTPAFEDYATANIADYDIALTEQGTASKAYMGTFPSAISAGTYHIRILIRAGGSPAETDSLAGVGTIHWTGAAVVDVVSGILDSIAGNVAGSVGGSVGSVTGNVGGNVVGSVASVTAGVSVANDGITAASIASDAITEIQSGLATASSIAALNNLSASQVNDEVDAALADINLDHLVKIAVDTDFPTTVHLDSVIGHLADNGTSATFDRTTDSLEVIAGNSGASAADIADAVWEEAIADHEGTAGSTAEALAAAAAGGGGGPSAADIADAVWDEATAGHTTAGTFGEQLKTDVDAILVDTAEIGAAGAGLTSLASAANLATVAGYLDTEIAAILADTNELQTDWANGGRLDVILDTAAAGGGGGPSAADIADAVWDEATAGHTTSGTFGEQLKTDVDAILADTNELQVDWVNGGRLDNILDARASQTSVDDLPTNAELAASQAAADDATLAAIAALNNISAAQVNAEVDTALADIRLNQLLAADSDIDGAAPPTVGSVFHELLSKTAGSFTFDQTTDSLEALRDRGDAAWITATGFSTHSAADVWAVATRTLTAGTNIQLPSNGLANVTTWTVAITGNITGNLSGNVTGNVGGNVSGNVVGSVGSLATQAQTDIRTATGLSAANLDTQLGAIDDFLDTEVAAIKAKTDNLPSDPADQSAVEAAITAATSSLATQASVNTIDDFLDTEVAAIKAKTDSLTFSTAGKVDAKLTSDGLDNLAVTAPSGVAATFREMVVQTWRRFFKKTVKSSSDIKTYADNGSTVLTTQTYTSASGTDTINEAT